MYIYIYHIYILQISLDFSLFQITSVFMVYLPSKLSHAKRHDASLTVSPKTLRRCRGTYAKSTTNNDQHQVGSGYC